MEKERLKKLLEEVRSGKVDIDEALQMLRSLPYEDLGFAKVDTHRELRKGFPEVVFCQGKTTGQIRAIVERLSSGSSCIMATKATAEVYDAIGEQREDAVYHETAGIVVVGKRKAKKRTRHPILVLSAGTSDIPVAEEAAVTAEIMGNEVERLYDSGVAGAHRLFSNAEHLFNASVIIVVAGMDGVLPSLVGGLVDRPVIAVPTSVGYGASFDGLAALLTMLNSCAPGVVVVNIDNGFGAGYVAAVIAGMSERKEEKE